MFYILIGLIIVAMVLLLIRMKSIKKSYEPSGLKLPKFQLWMVPVLIVIAFVAYIVISQAVELLTK
jgi:hypothetical protein